MISAHWLRKKPLSWAEYWDGPSGLAAPHRTLLVEELQRLWPFASLLEVGCGPCVNLARVRQAFGPSVHLTGFDVSESALELGQDRFIDAQLEPPQQLAVGALPEALSGDERFDVILSCYTLAYLSPEDLAVALPRLAHAARRALVIAEPMVVVGPETGQPHLMRPAPPEWRHDYVSYFRDDAPGRWNAGRWVDCTVDRMNRILVARRLGS